MQSPEWAAPGLLGGFNQALERAEPEQATLLFEDDLREMKAPFPTGRELEETVVVMRVFEAAKEPVSIEQIARHFAQGKQIVKSARLVVAALA